MLIDVLKPIVGKADIERIAEIYARAQGFPVDRFSLQAYVNPSSSAHAITALKDQFTNAELRSIIADGKIPNNN